MKTIVPVPITDAVVVSSSLVEAEPVYDPAATYNAGDECLVNHVAYTCTVAGTKGVEPSANISATSPAWAKGLPTNRWKMFDNYINTQSISDDTVMVTLDSSYCNGLSIVNINASSVDVSVKNSIGGVICAESVSLMSTKISKWEEYFFSKRRFTTSVWIEFPLRAKSTLTVIVKGAKPAIGMVIMGEVKVLGRTKLGSKFSTTDYSIYSVDTFGQIYLSKGNYARNFSGDVYLNSSDVQDVENTKAALRATITVFFCSNGVDRYGLHNYMTVAGCLKNFDVTIPRLTELECSVEISGTT